MERSELNTIQDGFDKKPESKSVEYDSLEKSQVNSSDSLHMFNWYDDITNRYYSAIFDGNGELILAQSSIADKDPPNPDVEDCELVADDGTLLYMSIFRKVRNVSKLEQMRAFEKKRLFRFTR